MGVIAAWAIGLLLDLLQGGLLGENALILSVISYLSYRFRFQIRVYPDWQIMVVTLSFAFIWKSNIALVKRIQWEVLFVTEEWLSIVIRGFDLANIHENTSNTPNYFVEE